MKKVLLLLLLFSSTLVFAEQIGQLNPYAYRVSEAVNDSTIEVTYSLNAPADSVVIAIYQNGVLIGSQSAPNTQGPHSVAIALASYSVDTTCSLGIRVYKQSYNAPVQLKKRTNGIEEAVNYAFYHPKGVDIDRNPSSPYFGRILTDEGMQGTPDAGYHSSAEKAGIYAFDASFAPIPNGTGKYAFKGGRTFYPRMTNGTTYAYTPYRIRISEDGRIFATMHEDRGSSLYELSQDLQVWTPVFSGTFDNGVLYDANNNYISSINCGFDVQGSGDDLKLIMLNCNSDALRLGGYLARDYIVATYNLGASRFWSGPPTTMDTLSNLLGNITTYAASSGIAADPYGGFWFHSTKIDMIESRSFCHINAAGQVDFEFHATAADTAKYHIVPMGSRGGGIRLVGNDLYVGMGYTPRLGSADGHMLVYTVQYDANGGVQDLQVKYDEHLIGIAIDLNDFALDYANNLYVVGNAGEMIVPVALPYSGMVETPVIKGVRPFVPEKDTLPTIVAGKDPYVYPIIGNHGEYRLTNRWLYSNVQGTFAANMPGPKDKVRGMAVVDDKIYFVNQATNSLSVVDARTGAMLPSIPIIGDHLFQRFDAATNIYVDCVYDKFTDLKADNAGHLLIGGAVNGRTHRMQVYKVDIATGVATPVVDENLYDNPAFGANLASQTTNCSFDGFGVFGDVNEHAIIMAADAGSHYVYKWEIQAGVAAPAIRIFASPLPTDTSQIVYNGNIAVTYFDPYACVYPEDFNHFYVDGRLHLPMRFDMEGHFLGDFASCQTRYRIPLVGDTINMDYTNNGVCEFQVGNEYFLLMTATSSNVIPGSTFALYSFANADKSFEQITPICFFPQEGMGNDPNSKRTTVPTVKVTENKATIYVYSANNGYGVYEISVDSVATVSLSLESDSVQGKVTGAGMYKELASVQIQALPNKGYQFSCWSDGNTERRRTIILTGETSLAAEFVEAANALDMIPEDISIEEMLTNPNTRVFTLLGQEISAYQSNLPTGVYILRLANKAAKIHVP